MQIKGNQFSAAHPIICVPVVEKTKEGILAAVGSMVQKQAAMIEWRMDWFEEIAQRERVLELLREIQPLVRETILLCTYRTGREGGEGTFDPSEYFELNRLVCESGTADLIDLEYELCREAGTDASHIIREFQQTGTGVICSKHDFQKTPSVEEMEQMLCEMADSGAEFAKLAVMPREKADVLHLMEAVLRTREGRPSSHLIAMSMDRAGMISRILGGWFGSEVTFASFGAASAPGQLHYEQAQKLLEELDGMIRN